MSVALQTWGQMMLKKYLPEMLVVLLITILSFALWTQTNRLNAAKNQTKAVQLAFDQYRIDQQAEVQKEQQHLIQQYNQALEQKNEAITKLQKNNTALHNSIASTERLLNTANANLRQARETANKRTCEDARSAARLCTNLYAKLDTRVREDERRISAIGQYADQLRIELEACVKVKQD